MDDKFFMSEARDEEGYQSVRVKAPAWITITDTAGLDDESVGLGRTVPPGERGYVVVKVNKTADAAFVLFSKHNHRHETDLDKLTEYESPECARIPVRQRSMCPLLGTIERIGRVEGGARVEFKSWVSLDKVITHSLCHVSFGRKNGKGLMTGCPLYVPGVQVKKSRDGHALEITGENAEEAKEIRRRLLLIYGR